MTVYIGIDPGKKGAIAVGEYGRMFLFVTCRPLPQTFDTVKKLLWGTPYDPRYAIVALEKPHIQYGNPHAGQTDYVWANGKLAGWLEAICGREPHMVAPNTWKKAVLGSGKADKAAAIAMAQAEFPDVSLLRTKRSRKQDDNFADALCIMLWARRVRLEHDTSERNNDGESEEETSEDEEVRLRGRL